MIANDRKLFGWTESLSDYPLPSPFTAISQKSKKLDYNGVEVTARMIRPLIKALIYYAKDQIASENGLDPTYFAIGTNAAKGKSGEENIFVELQDPDNDPDLVICTMYDKAAGKIRGCIYKKSLMTAGQYTIKGPSPKCPDATAVWAALLPDLFIVSDLLQKTFDALKAMLENPTTCTPAYLCDEYFYEMSYQVYDILVKTGPIDIDYADNLTLIKNYDLQNKKLGPAFGKVEMGKFQVFPIMNGSASAVSAKVYDLSSYHFTFVREELTEEEKLLIPTIPEDNVTPKEAVDLLDEMQATWSNPPATKITQVLLEGGAGSGKSYLARLIAAVLKRPFVSFTCSPNTDEADIKGALLPVASEDELAALSDDDSRLLRVIYDSNENELYDNMAQAMDLPDSMECFFAPESAYEQLTGNSTDTCDSQTAYSLLCSTVMAKVKELMQAVQSVASADSGVRYKYVPSAIVRAVQNGWLLELQEPSCMLQQGMLSCLFDVLDKDSIGALNTNTGTIFRHPDFLCIATTNRKYKGTKPLNEAARSRFQYFCKMETPSEEVIIQRVAKKVGLTDMDLVRGITEVFKKLEERAGDINASGAATMRGLYAFADAIKRNKDMNFALEHYLLYSITTDDDELAELREALEDCALIKM